MISLFKRCAFASSLSLLAACGRVLTSEQDATADAAVDAHDSGAADPSAAQAASGVDWFDPSSAEPPDQEWSQHNPAGISLVNDADRTALRLDQGSSLYRTYAGSDVRELRCSFAVKIESVGLVDAEHVQATIAGPLGKQQVTISFRKDGRVSSGEVEAFLPVNTWGRIEIVLNPAELRSEIQIFGVSGSSIATAIGKPNAVTFTMSSAIGWALRFDEIACGYR